MISFNRLGNLGRLGNQMFQYSAIRGIAARHNYEFCIPPKEAFGNEDLKVHSDINNTIYDIFELGEFNRGFCSNPIVQESTHAFDKSLFENCPDNVDFLGYFQTQKYFEHIEEEIKKDFTFKKEIRSICKEYQFLKDMNYISLHIRRGDYVNLQDHHPVQSIEYYENALEYFDSKNPVVIFSDDPEWCKKQALFESDRFIVSENNETSVDLCLMTMCQFHIIANSSLSWWGAYLADSIKVVAPKNWFNAKQGIDTSDKYLQNWIIL